MSSIPARPVTVVEVVDAVVRRAGTITTHRVLLHDDLDRSFAIPVGPCEALGIRYGLSGEFTQRPLTHDLIYSVLTRLGAAIDRVVIERNADEWQATITLRGSSGRVDLKTNHGDAIAVALRANATIYATEEAILNG
jgi:uncharacterized protein